MRKLIAIFVFVLLVAVLPSTLLACPTCKQSLADANNNPNLVRGYAWSIMFMMSSPFLIFASLGGYFYYEICRARALQKQDGPSASNPVTSPV